MSDEQSNHDNAECALSDFHGKYTIIAKGSDKACVYYSAHQMRVMHIKAAQGKAAELQPKIGKLEDKVTSQQCLIDDVYGVLIGGRSSTTRVELCEQLVGKFLDAPGETKPEPQSDNLKALREATDLSVADMEAAEKIGWPSSPVIYAAIENGSARPMDSGIGWIACKFNCDFSIVRAALRVSQDEYKDQQADGN